jgi:hypothetical protein
VVAAAGVGTSDTAAMLGQAAHRVDCDVVVRAWVPTLVTRGEPSGLVSPGSKKK